MWSRKIADPYVVTSPAVSKRSLTPREIPSPGSAGRARKALRLSSGKDVVDLGDGDRAGEEDEREAEERKSPAEVLPCQVRPGFHQTSSGSSAIATKRSARYASEKLNSRRARAG